MSTIVVAISVTWTGPFTATTIPSPTGARTLATGDNAINAIAEDTRRRIKDLFEAVDPAANAHTTVTSTVT